LSPRKLVQSNKLIRGIGIFALIILLITGTAIAIPERFAQGTIRVFNPNTAFPKMTNTILTISLPNSGRAVRFNDYTIKIKATGEIPDKVWIYRKLGEQGYSPFEAQTDPANPELFRYTFRKLVEDVQFFVVGGDYKSRTIKITTLDLPRVVDVSLEYHFPSYTNMATQRIERNDGNIDALYGTRVNVEARVSKDVKTAKIMLNDSTEIPMKCDGKEITGKLTVKGDGTYSIQVWDSDGNSDPQPPQYSIHSQPDEIPVVQITYPGKDIDINEEMKVPIQVYGEDDFGFSKFILKYVVVTQESTEHSFELPFSLFGEKQVTLDFTWNLDPLGLIPDDVVKYWIEGYDNDMLTGPKMSKSKVYSLRFPSIDEIIEEVTGERKEQMESVDEAIQAQKEFVKQTEKLIRQIKQDNEQISYQQKEQVQHLIEQQQNLVEQLEQTVQKMQTTLERIQENQMVAQQILEKMWEIQKLLDEILPDELKEAIRKMQEALEQMDPEMLKQAMKQFQLSQQELIQKLDRTLELLKRVQAEMKLDEMKKLAERIQELQEKINRGLESGEDTEKLERMQQQAKKQLNNLEKGMKKLAEEMAQFDDMPSEEMRELAQNLEDAELPEEAQTAIEQMKQGNLKNAQKSGQKISEQMKKLTKNLDNLQQKMNQMLQQQLSLDIQKTVRELIYISDEQERLLTQVDDMWNQREQIRKLAPQQERLRTALKLSIQRVYDMGGKTFMLPPAVGAHLANADNNMSSAAEKLALGYSGLGIAKIQSEAMGHINAAAEILLRSMESMCQSSSASGMEQLMQQLQNMCNKQGQINTQTLPLMGACQNPGGLNPQQRAAASRLSAEQEALRKSLQQLQQEFEQHSNLLGRMDQTIEDMMKVEEDLRKYNINERTLQRQDRILSRMLDAQKSLHKREYTEKRRSRTGEDVIRKSPGQLPDDLGERRDILQQSLLQILSNPYPRQYQSEVRKYFRALRSVNQPDSRDETIQSQ
ncbi:hypothetical protein DRQ33_02595, partial [bacterium]